jgi:hypothetical protein
MVSTSKMIGSIDREVRALSASMDDLARHLLATYPDSGLTVRRTPDRVVLQAGSTGVSVSLFRSRAGAEASAEVVLARWEGEITLPGSTQHGGHATQVSEHQFHIVECDDTSWGWVDDTTSVTMTSQALAATCIDTMAGHLQHG